jgi:hypothetical protein
MILHDMNQSWTHPEGYTFYGVVAEGAFLRAEYRQRVFKTGTIIHLGTNVVMVYLNDQGREVARTRTWRKSPPRMVEPLPQKYVRRRFRIWNGILIMLEGIQEMFR